MIIKSLSLTNFRRFKQQKINFDKGITIFVGSNGIGKTSVVEAINLLATGTSFRAGKVEEMIQLGQELGRVKGFVQTGVQKDADDQGFDDLAGLDEVELDLTLTRGVVQGRKTLKTLFAVNQNNKRKKNFLGNFYCVTFRPEDLRLIEGSPTRRRSYIDNPLLMLDQFYAEALKKYEQALRRRNKLLQLINEGKQRANTLTFWNMQLVKHGEFLQKKRRDYLDFVNKIGFSVDFQMEYKPSIISQKRIDQYQQKEIIVGHTLIGPHKDDFEVTLNKKDLSTTDSFAGGKEVYYPLSIYGSRGQQRMGVLWLKIAEFEFIKYQINDKPVLLLDDIMSELDEISQSRVRKIFDGGQVIITSANQRFLKKFDINFCKVKLT
jgi:DNA replication and repair protein RecF